VLLPVPAATERSNPQRHALPRPPMKITLDVKSGWVSYGT
jgi:hypothetical protein